MLIHVARVVSSRYDICTFYHPISSIDESAMAIQLVKFIICQISQSRYCIVILFCSNIGSLYCVDYSCDFFNFCSSREALCCTNSRTQSCACIRIYHLVFFQPCVSFSNSSCQGHIFCICNQVCQLCFGNCYNLPFRIVSTL